MKTTSSIKCLPIRLMLSEWRSTHKLAMRIQEAAHKKFIKFNRLAGHFRCFGATCEVVNIWESRFRPLSANVGSWPLGEVGKTTDNGCFRFGSGQSYLTSNAHL